MGCGLLLLSVPQIEDFSSNHLLHKSQHSTICQVATHMQVFLIVCENDLLCK